MTSVTSLIVRLFSILCLKQLQVVGVAESLHEGTLIHSYLLHTYVDIVLEEQVFFDVGINFKVFRHDQA